MHLGQETEIIIFNPIDSGAPIIVYPKQTGQSKEETDSMGLIGC